MAEEFLSARSSFALRCCGPSVECKHPPNPGWPPELQKKYRKQMQKWPANWEKESMHRPAPVKNFLLPQKNGGHRGKISVVDMAFLVFIGFLYPPLAWKVFLCGQKSSPKDFLSVVVVYAFFFSAQTTVFIFRRCT